MNGYYSKMRQSSNLQKPKSMDLSTDSDLFSSPHQPHKNNVKIIPNEETKSHNDTINKFHSSSSSSGRKSFSAKFSKENSGKGSERFSSAVKKVMPMRRSSSVSSSSSEKYCRIINDSEFLEIDDEEKEADIPEWAAETTRKIKKMGSSRNRIFNACKRIFGFKT